MSAVRNKPAAYCCILTKIAIPVSHELKFSYHGMASLQQRRVASEYAKIPNYGTERANLKIFTVLAKHTYVCVALRLFPHRDRRQPSLLTPLSRITFFRAGTADR